MSDWTLEGTTVISDREVLPNKIREVHDTEHFAVFANGERLLFVPRNEVEP